MAGRRKSTRKRTARSSGRIHVGSSAGCSKHNARRYDVTHDASQYESTDALLRIDEQHFASMPERFREGGTHVSVIKTKRGEPYLYFITECTRGRLTTFIMTDDEYEALVRKG